MLHEPVVAVGTLAFLVDMDPPLGYDPHLHRYVGVYRNVSIEVLSSRRPHFRHDRRQ